METRPARDPAVTAGIVCLLLYIAAAWFVPFLGPILTSPLLLAAFVLGIVGAARGRITGGVGLVVASGIVGLAGCATSCASIASAGL